MGASEFITTAHGPTMQKAFAEAIEDASYEHGHGGYTGSIAEKRQFVTVDVPAGKDPYEHAQDILNGDNHLVCDKYGPAGCIDLGDNNYIFFGVASA